MRSKYLRRLVAVDNPQAAQTLAKKPREDAQAYDSTTKTNLNQVPYGPEMDATGLRHPIERSEVDQPVPGRLQRAPPPREDAQAYDELA